MKKHILTKGFTLIELLVVIAIIGLLSTIVVVSLSTVRQKGASTGVTAQLKSIATQAEIYYNTNGNYGTIALSCTWAGTPPTLTATGFLSDTATKQMLQYVKDNATSGPTCTGDAATSQKWAVHATLKDGTVWCVDSSGWNKAGTGVAGVCS